MPPSTLRGRHAPPLEVRRDSQRARLLEAAGAVFARDGYSAASAEAIARQARMSKATFYEHFANKEQCILALFDSAAEALMTRLTTSLGREFPDYRSRLEAGMSGFLDSLAENPEATQTLLVEIIGAGPRAAGRRDAILDAFTDAIVATNRVAAERFDHTVYASRDDAYAVVGAIVELVSRRLRTGGAAELHQLQPVIVRLILGVLSQGPPPPR